MTCEPLEGSEYNGGEEVGTAVCDAIVLVRPFCERRKETRLTRHHGTPPRKSLLYISSESNKRMRDEDAPSSAKKAAHSDGLLDLQALLCLARFDIPEQNRLVVGASDGAFTCLVVC